MSKDFVHDYLRSASKAISEQGYFVLPTTLPEPEVSELRELYDRDRATFPTCWRDIGGHYSCNFDILVTSPQVDKFVRHPTLLPLVKGLMGGPVAVADLMFSYKVPFDGTPYAGWHRDCAKLTTHPLGLMHLQVLLYLADVTPLTHCFSVAGESASATTRDEIGVPLPRPASATDLLGPAGTVIFFNPAVAHGATTRVTPHERKTLHVYFGHRDGPYGLWDESIIPPTFSVSHPDPEVRAIYGMKNRRTVAFAEAFGVAL